jgi:hypothetical protein
VTRDELMTRALGRRLLPTDRSLDTHVSNLRRKLAKYTDRVTLQSVRGTGYALALAERARSTASADVEPPCIRSSGASFLTFWLALALILVGTVTVAVDAALKWRNDRPSLPYQEIYSRAAQVFEAGGGDALKQWIQELSPPALRERTFVLDSSGHDLLERPLPSYAETNREGQRRRARECRPSRSGVP